MPHKKQATRSRGQRYLRMEHRCGHRRSIEAPVIVRTRTGLVARGVIRNVSASGALICAPLPLPLHTPVLIQLTTPERHRPPTRVALAGDIARVLDGGFAVEWSEFAPHTLRVILRTWDVREAMGEPRHKLDSG